jgi:putative drug exporter of the RND superfamily
VNAWSPADPSSRAGKAALAEIKAAAAAPGARSGGSPAQGADFITALYSLNLAVIIAANRDPHVRPAGPGPAVAVAAGQDAAAEPALARRRVRRPGLHLAGRPRHHRPVPQARVITLWVLLAIFALLFRLSMDHEVFILTRINEEYEQAGQVRPAVVRSIGHTGRLITSGALILCLAFIALGGVAVTYVKILSTGLAAGIIIDATIIRGILALARGRPLGQANWWLPRPAARLLRITPLTAGTAHGSRAPPGRVPGRNSTRSALTDGSGKASGLASFAGQKRAERPQVQVEVFDGEAEVVPQLSHPGFKGHQSRSDLLDLIVGQRPLFHPAQGLTLHQLAQ